MRRRGAQDWQAGAAVMLAAWPEPAALLDRQGRVLAVNDAGRALLGAALPTRPGDDARAWFPLAEQPGFVAAIAQGGGRLPLTLTAPLAAPRVIEAMLQPLEKAALLLRLGPEAPQLREERLALLGRMAGGVAHDFNNLLGIVIGASAAAASAADATARGRELAAIDAAADRGAALVRQLLAFSRQQVLAPRILRLNDAVAAIGALLPRLLGTGIALDLVLEEPGRLVLADPTQLDQVIINLVANARDAIQISGKGGRIRLETGRRVVLQAGGENGLPPGRYASIIVEDDGPGIPPAIMMKIFEPFFTTRIDQGGTGLGLATVQGIIAQSGGHILAESPPGGGTRFTILLPRQEGGAL
jgi:two-component system cell cycle sensor histidine kinase/response regulator CckA